MWTVVEFFPPTTLRRKIQNSPSEDRRRFGCFIYDAILVLFVHPCSALFIVLLREPFCASPIKQTRNICGIILRFASLCAVAPAFLAPFLHASLRFVFVPPFCTLRLFVPPFCTLRRFVPPSCTRRLAYCAAFFWGTKNSTPHKKKFNDCFKDFQRHTGASSSK